jgi:UDP-N-acetylglucosamine transferase subunit ALG13
LIFVTVGAQLPFDRLILAVDEWARARGRRDVFAQIGETSAWPRHIEFAKTLDVEAFEAKLRECSAVVAHAGMGTILSALQHGKPLLVMPRRGDFGETRNDHQVATARRFAEQRLLAVAETELELPERLDQLQELRGGPPIQSSASAELIEAIRAFIRETRKAS